MIRGGNNASGEFAGGAGGVSVGGRRVGADHGEIIGGRDTFTLVLGRTSGTEVASHPPMAKMTRRSILAAGKSGSISRADARKAASAVKLAKLRGGYSKKLPWADRKDGATTLGVEEYLGHFGGSVGEKSPRKTKSAAKKAPAKKFTAKKAYRRAS